VLCCGEHTGGTSRAPKIALGKGRGLTLLFCLLFLTRVRFARERVSSREGGREGGDVGHYFEEREVGEDIIFVICREGEALCIRVGRGEGGGGLVRREKRVGGELDYAE